MTEAIPANRKAHAARHSLSGAKNEDAGGFMSLLQPVENAGGVGLRFDADDPLTVGGHMEQQVPKDAVGAIAKPIPACGQAISGRPIQPA